jgi:hypothetical protein
MDVALIQIFIGRFDRQLSAVRHRVPSIDGQIYDHLLDLSLIGLHPAQISA